MSKKRILGTGLTILLVFTMLLVMAGPNLLAAQLTPIPGNAPFPGNEKIEVLIGFHGPPNRGLVEAFGGEVYAEFTIVDVIAAQMTPRAAEALGRAPAVRYIEPDSPVYAIGQTVPWGINRVFGGESNVAPTWTASSKGLGIGVAVLDTGIDQNHEDLPELLGGVNTVDNTHWGSDGNGHGTHVAGTVAALDNDLGVVGVGPKLGLYAVKVLSDGGSGTASSVVAGIEWAVMQGIPVLNMSLGSSENSTTMEDACKAAYDKGHLLVAAAGNSGMPSGRGDNVGYPAAYESVIAVAASDSSDNRARFSSTGPAVELIAPGSSILSTTPGNKYETKSGTSMASPHAAGAAALAWAANTSLTNVQIREGLRKTAEDLGLSANHQGYGLVRADLAVAAVSGTEAPSTGNINGTVVSGEDNTVIVGATVAVEGTTLSSTTNGNGYYLLENVPAVEQEVRASADGYYSLTATVTVLENETVPQNFTLQAIPTYTLSGTVYDSDNNPLAGATVKIEETGLSATTDSDGTYSIYNVIEGTYNITASKEGYSSKAEIVTVNNDTTVNFVLEKTTEATGIVTVTSIAYTTSGGRNGDRHLHVTVALVDDKVAPVSGAKVEIVLYWGDSPYATSAGTTNGDGTVTFSYNNAPSGLYTTTVTGVTAEGLDWDKSSPENSYDKP